MINVHWLLVVSPWSSVIRDGSFIVKVIGHWGSLVIDDGSEVIGRLPLVIGHWSWVIGHRPYSYTHMAVYP